MSNLYLQNKNKIHTHRQHWITVIKYIVKTQSKVTLW